MDGSKCLNSFKIFSFQLGPAEAVLSSSWCVCVPPRCVGVEMHNVPSVQPLKMLNRCLWFSLNAARTQIEQKRSFDII